MTTPNALTQALEASQAKAVAALGKAYVRRAETPDDDLFRGLMHKVGLDDDVAISFLLHAWAILREQREQPPGEQATPRTEGEPASEAQWNLLRKLADERGTVAPDEPLTKQQAHEAIDRLKAGTYNPDDYALPF